MTDRGTIAIAVACLLACVSGAAALVGPVRSLRDELQLVMPAGDTSGMPPHVAIVTAALGTFRGLAVDVLWARAEHLQDRGEFYEAQTLSQWITTLQPRFQRVWAFQAWNMAYNISVATQVPAERWGWVSRGIELLRSRGIPLNPKAANLYFDLAWLFQNKIGRVGDKEHWYFKARFASDLQEVLGDLNSGRTTAETIERFRKIAEAPATLAELLKRAPGVEKALAKCTALNAAPDESLVRMLGRVQMVRGSLDAKLLGRETLPEGTNVPFLEALAADEGLATAVLEELVPHLQRRILEDRYGMKPEKMLAVMERYGPLDWRHPLSHGVYWSEEGVAVSRLLASRKGIDELSLIRGRLLLLMELLRQGRLELDSVTDRVDLLPDPRFARQYEDSVIEAFNLIMSQEGVMTGAYGLAEERNLYATYEKFLNVATMLTFLYGEESEAERYFKLLRELMVKQGEGDGPLYQESVENFVAMKFWGQTQVNLADLRQFLDAMFRRAFLDGLGKADFRAFNRFLGVARTVYDKRFKGAQLSEKIVLQESKILQFPKLVENSFETLMKDRSLPLLTRARVWAWSPEQLREAVYESLAAGLAEEATSAGINPSLAFPAPVDAQSEGQRQESGRGGPGAS